LSPGRTGASHGRGGRRRGRAPRRAGRVRPAVPARGALAVDARGDGGLAPDGGAPAPGGRRDPPGRQNRGARPAGGRGRSRRRAPRAGAGSGPPEGPGRGRAGPGVCLLHGRDGRGLRPAVAGLASGARMTRVVHVRSAQGLYGAERSLLALAAATEPPFEPLVVSLMRPGLEDALGAAAGRMGLPAARVAAPGRLSPSALGPLVRLARGGLLHAHDYKALALSLVAGALARAPVVATFHGDTGHLARVVVYERLARRAARFTVAVAATS